jgi:hypothetical protein
MGPVSEKETQSERVECAHLHIAAPLSNKRADAIFHLVCCFVREGNGKKVPWFGGSGGNKVGYLVREDARFSASGAGEHKKRTVTVRHSLSLAGIQLFQQIPFSLCHLQSFVWGLFSEHSLFSPSL